MIKLSKISTLPPEGAKKKEYEDKTKKICKRIAELQGKMNAEGKRSLLVIFQEWIPVVKMAPAEMYFADAALRYLCLLV